MSNTVVFAIIVGAVFGPIAFQIICDVIEERRNRAARKKGLYYK